MSPKYDKDVAKLVRKYRTKYPAAPRPLLRETLRLKLEKQRAFTESVKKKLDRELAKAFEIENGSMTVSRMNWNPPPRLHYDVTQNIHGSSRERHLPNVGFCLLNQSEYPLKVILEVRTLLGGRNLGLIRDRKGYYNGETEIPLEPGKGFMNGNFSVPEECVNSSKELSVEVRPRAIDQIKGVYEFSPMSWTYIRSENAWFYEPRAFTEE